MERFLFSLADGDSHVEDERLDLPDVAAARAEATRFLSDALRRHGNQFWREGRWVVTVADERGLVLFSIFVDAVAAAALGQGGP